MSEKTDSERDTGEARRAPPTRQPSHLGRGTTRRDLGRWLKRGVLALIAGAVAYAIISAFLPEPVTVDVGVSSRGRMQVFVEEDGRTRVRERYVVSAPISGTLRRIEIEAGDPVERNDVVARLLPPSPVLLDARNRAELEARLAGAVARKRQADADLARAAATRKLAVIEAARARKLTPDTMSESDRDRFLTEERLAIEAHAAAIQQRNAAAAEVRAVRATLATDRAESNGEIFIRAPSGGSVLRVLRESEGPVSVGAPLVEIGDTRALEIVVDILSSDAVTIATGTEVWIERWGGGDILHGKVTRVEPSAFTLVSALGVEEQRTNVIAEMDHAPASLGDGYRIEARLLAWEGSDVIHVPASAVFRRGDGWAVYVVDEDTARLRNISVGHRSRHAVEVTRGLEVDTAVLLYPGDKIEDGVSIRVRR